MCFACTKALVCEGVREHGKIRHLRGLGRSSTAPAHKNERGHIEGRGGPELEEEVLDHFSGSTRTPSPGLRFWATLRPNTDRGQGSEGTAGVGYSLKIGNNRGKLGQ